MRRGVLSTAVLLACTPLPAESLSDIDFPPGFELRTTHEVLLTVRGRAPGPDARIVVRTPDGAPLYDGGLGLALRHPLRLRVPTGTTAVDLIVDGTAHRVPIEDQRVAFLVGSAP